MKNTVHILYLVLLLKRIYLILIKNNLRTFQTEGIRIAKFLTVFFIFNLLRMKRYSSSKDNLIRWYI